MPPESTPDHGQPDDPDHERPAAARDDGDRVPLEVLERNLTTHAAHIASAEARWLGWLGESKLNRELATSW